MTAWLHTSWVLPAAQPLLRCPAVRGCPAACHAPLCADDALNRAAGSLLHSDRPGFERAVSASVHEGAVIEGER